MRSIQRALSIFEAFSNANPSLSLTEIGQEVGLSKATTFRLARSLEEAGYLVRLENQRYSLSFKFVRLAGLAQGFLDLRTVVRPSLAKLAREAGESVTFHGAEDQSRVCIEVVNAPAPLMSVNRPGERVPLGLGGASLVLMAHLPSGRLATILPFAARNAKCSKKELSNILGTVLRQGYAVSHGGGVPGVSGISAPVYDPNGEAQYCVTIVVPTVRVGGHVSDLVALVKASALEISRKLGQA